MQNPNVENSIIKKDNLIGEVLGRALYSLADGGIKIEELVEQAGISVVNDYISDKTNQKLEMTMREYIQDKDLAFLASRLTSGTILQILLNNYNGKKEKLMKVLAKQGMSDVGIIIWKKYNEYQKDSSKVNES